MKTENLEISNLEIAGPWEALLWLFWAVASPFGRIRRNYNWRVFFAVCRDFQGAVNQDNLSERLWDFAARVGKVVDALPETRLGRHVAGQLIRCGTSAPPNYDESGAAESRDDFIHKLSVALKELRESRGWLRFIGKSSLLPEKEMAQLLDEADQLCRIFGKSIITAKASRGK